MMIIDITVIGRFLSGVHWFIDIVGGMWFGLSLSMYYLAVIKRMEST